MAGLPLQMLQGICPIKQLLQLLQIQRMPIGYGFHYRVTQADKRSSFQVREVVAGLTLVQVFPIFLQIAFCIEKEAVMRFIVERM